ncbi:putative T7SS-secreted protein [Streptomyces monticola]|uniref:T7SS-secreted protein n=1 Tax=Streptomyces monticola TaxID=2666263 RepID=A0ABW2JJJ7_9ACTN
MGFGDALNSIGDAADGAIDTVKEKTGEAVGWAADKTADGLGAVGADSAAEGVRDVGEGVNNRLGGDVAERGLGESEDPKELIHGSAPAIEKRAGQLKDFAAAFEKVGRGLAALDSGAWQGKAGDAFREAWDMQPMEWLKAADACEDASSALRRYAETVEWSQAQAVAAIETFKSAQKTTQSAAQAHDARVAEYETAATDYTRLAMTGADPGPEPTAPGDFKDPGAAGRKEAQEILDEARRQRTEAAGDARRRVQRALEAAPPKPEFIDRVGANFTDGVQSHAMNLAHFGAGALKGLGETVALARTVNPIDPYNLTHPGQWMSQMQLLGAGLAGTVAHPERLPKAFIGAGWTSDPGEALGKFAANLIGGKGAGGLAKTAGKSAVSGAARSTVRESLAQAAKRLKCRIFGDPIDIATGRMLLPQTDVSLPGRLPLLFTRRFESAYRSGRWFGPSWSSTADERLEIDAEGVIFVREGGSLLAYPHPAPGVPVLPFEGDRYPLVVDPYGDYSVIDEEHGRAWHFAGPGGDGNGIALLAQITDRSGQYLTFDYDAEGAPTGITHSAGHRLLITTEGARITALHLAGGAPDGGDQELVRFGYDTDGHLASVTNSSGLPTRFANDALGRITSWTDTNDSTYSYVYDERHRCTSQSGQEGHLASTYTYDTTDPETGHQVVTATDSLGHTTRFLVNSQYHVVAETGPDGATTYKTYDEQDHELTATDALGRTVSQAYDAAGRPTMVVRPDGSYTSVAYDDFGLPTVIAQSDGRCTYQEFDEYGNHLSVTDAASGTRTRFTYDAHGNLSGITDALGATTAVRCDPAGLPLEITDPMGAVTRYERDAFGRPVTITDSLGAVTHLEWTVEGRLSRRTGPDGSTESWTYDGEGNCLTHTDAMGAVSRFEYTHFDLLSARTGPDGVRYAFEHDTQLQLRKVTNPQGLTWTYDYDPAGRLIAETDFDDRTLTYAHDAAGRLTSRTTAMGDVIRFERDILGRTVRKDAAGAITTYDYDTTGALARAVNQDAVLELERDAAGRVLSETVNGRTLTYTYDELGRRVDRRTPAGAVSSWTYDAGGRRTSLHTSGRTISFTHDAAGRELSRTLGESLTLTNAYDPAGRLTKQDLFGPSNDPVQSRSYTYRADGNLTAIDDALNGSRSFDLDAAGRVTAVRAEGWTETYAYDEAGNQTEASWPSRMPSQEATGPRSYVGTRIRTAGGVRYEHDAAGRTILRQKPRLSRKPDTWHFSWDAEDRLTSVVTPDGVRWRYLYDALGRRIAKQRLADSEVVAEQVDFTWDGTTLCEQTSRASGAPESVSLTWDHDGLRPLTQSERKITTHHADAQQSEIDERFYAIVTDLVGAPTELLGEQGEVTWRARTTLWGATVWNRRATSYTPLRFPGQYFDQETGLHYNYFRSYDPECARYLTQDPLGLDAAPNPVTYVSNPHAWIDPLGLSPCPPRGEASNPFQYRQDAERAVFEAAGVPHGSTPDAEWTVTGNRDLKHAPGYTYSSNPTHWGHFRQFETPSGSRVVVEHTFDKAGPHFHAGSPKGMTLEEQMRSFVNFGWDNARTIRPDGTVGYPENMERYAKINKQGGDHHFFYQEGWGS